MRNSHENERVYALCGQEKGFRFKAAELILRLTDRGLSYTIDGTNQHYGFGDLKSIRLIAHDETRRSPAFSVAELDFGNGRRLHVSSLTPWGREDAARARAYADFIPELHARLSPEDVARIRFFRGPASLSGARKWFVFGFGVVLAAMVLFIALNDLVISNFSVGSIVTVLFLVAYVLFARKQPEPPTYDPRNLPPELFPEP